MRLIYFCGSTGEQMLAHDKFEFPVAGGLFLLGAIAFPQV